MNAQARLNQVSLETWEGHLIEHKIVKGKLHGIQRFIFTYGVLLDVKPLSYGGRYCFSDLCAAQGFLRAYDGTQIPVVGEEGCTAIK